MTSGFYSQHLFARYNKANVLQADS